jgi:DNA-3-methyladenine glycosylase II
MAGLIDDYGGPLPDRPRRRPEVYPALLRAIVGQQLSVRSAEAIYGRMLQRYGGAPPTPEALLADDADELRTSTGLSHAKTAALRSLAEHVLAGELELSHLQTLTDDEVIAALTTVKGIGTWTSHLFLMFTLQRPDVLAVGDQGIKNAVKRAYGLETVPKPDALTLLAEPWRPFRTRACLYLWRYLRATPI